MSAIKHIKNTIKIKKIAEENRTEETETQIKVTERKKKSLINLHAVMCIVFLTSQPVTFTQSLAWPSSAWCHGCGRSRSHYDISSNGSLVHDTCTWSHPYNNSIWNCYFCICVHYNCRISVCVASERQRCDQRLGVKFKRVCVLSHSLKQSIWQ